VTENEGQYSFFTDGTLALITPIPDAAHVQAYAHIPLTVHPEPRHVLLIGGGPGGLIHEMLKHPGVDRIDYAELDPLIVELLRTYPTDLTEAELGSARVSVKLTDGRSHLLRAGKRYDVIVSTLTEPSDLETNRFFTREFFQLASKRLFEDGILVVRFPSGLGFRTRELVNLVASLHGSLASVFPYFRAFPGEGGTMVVASTSPSIMSYDAKRLILRLAQRGLAPEAALPWGIERRLHAGWQRWYLDLVGGGRARENRDFAPIGVFLSLSYWNSLHGPQLIPVFRVLRKVRSWMIAAVLVVGAAVVALVRFTGRRSRSPVIVPSVLGTGVAGMLFSLSLIFSFQSLFGHLFSWIGLLTAVFMAGSTAGAWAMIRQLPRIRNLPRAMAATEVAILLSAVLLPVIVPRIGALLEQGSAWALLRSLFLGLPFVCGMLTGAQFPVAARLREADAHPTTAAAGSLYAADLMGGWVGGMLGAVFLIPVLGLAGTGLTVALLKLCGLVLFLASLVRLRGA
jgi:spermidine synthase